MYNVNMIQINMTAWDAWLADVFGPCFYAFSWLAIADSRGFLAGIFLFKKSTSNIVQKMEHPGG